MGVDIAVFHCKNAIFVPHNHDDNAPHILHTVTSLRTQIGTVY